METVSKPTVRRRNQRNYYRILFVQPDAPMEIVQASYRTIMQKLGAHPDLGGDTWNASIINEAYQTLNDPDARRRYDADLFADKTYGTLSLQSTANREGPADASPAAAWEEFKPQKI